MTKKRTTTTKRERSPGGSPIYHHEQEAPPDSDVSHADDARITSHLRRTIGEPGMVWHEIVSDRVHVDVHVVEPAEERPFFLLMTSGMSGRPMTVPPEMEGYEQWRHAELCIILPPDWPLDRKAFEDERYYWPVRLLKALARLPHDFQTWLGWGHSIPNGHPAVPYAPGTKLAGAVLIPPFQLGKDFFVVPGEPPLHVFQVLPVTAKEMDLKLKLGLEKFLERLEKKYPMIYGPIDPMRASAA